MNFPSVRAVPFRKKKDSGRTDGPSDPPFRSCLVDFFSAADFWNFRYDGEFGKEGFQKEIVDGGNDLFDGGNKVFVATNEKVFQVIVGMSAYVRAV